MPFQDKEDQNDNKEEVKSSKLDLLTNDEIGNNTQPANVDISNETSLLTPKI